jgi:hypothetical protein
MNKMSNKRGYFKLKSLNDFIETRLFVSIDYDDMISARFCEEVGGAQYLTNSINRAILLSFLSERNLYSDNQKADEKFMKSFLPLDIWKNIKQTYQQFVYTPTILYFWLKNTKNSTPLCESLCSTINIVFIDELKKLNLSQRQSMWLNSIIVPNFFFKSQIGK